MINAGAGAGPASLGEGNPQRAELVIRNRARGEAHERLAADPDLPRARLERTIVLHFSSADEVPDVLAALAEDPDVEFAEQNRPIRFHSAGAAPPVPKATLPLEEYFGPEGGDPEGHQWWAFILRLPDAWDLIEGHAVVALLDRGIQPGHFDLEPFDDSQAVPLFVGGNYRENLAYDYIGEDCDVDETQDPATQRAGHGTHVSGIVGATANNGLGVVGVCWHCPIAMAKIWNQDGQTGLNDAARAITEMVDRGAQLISMSFGLDGDCASSPGFNLGLLCSALALANEHDVLITASVGNDRAPVVEFPAVDSRVVAVGGIAPGGAFWDDWPNCPYGFQQSFECGSNYGPQQELVAPAKWVLSTVYTGAFSNATVRCGDPYGTVGNSADGIGLCTGTSMSAPAVAGIAGLVRTANPLLSQGQVRGLLRATATLGGGFDLKLGYGIPDAGAAVMAAMGRVGGSVLRNRLTAFFSFYSSADTVHLYTTSPQRAAAAVAGNDGSPFLPIGTPVPAYSAFPDEPVTPRASVFLFTAPHAPLGQSFTLLPLYRMSKDPNRQEQCTGSPQPGAQWSFAYARASFEILSLRNAGYALDGIEGYVIDPSGPLPSRAVLLHRLYNPSLDDWVVVPTSEVSSLSAGYVVPAGFAEIVGAAFPNVDSDGDAVIDGFETMIGTSPSTADSDGDGINDGHEILGYTGATPSGILGDPLCPGTSCLFADGFETGGTSRWSSVVP
jgi:hypothetical protein